MTPRHFIDTQDFTKAEILDIIALTRMIKEADRLGATPRLLADASLAMIFEEPSTRTRVSFEVAMSELGGHALYLKPGEIHLGQRESLSDTAAVLSRMCDVIMARTLKHSTMLGLAEAASVPVINGLTDYNHPTQVVCDVLTMLEHKPVGKRLEDLKVTFIGDSTNVLSSLMHICTQMGMHFTHAAPRRYQPPASWLQIAEQNCRISGGTLHITEDPVQAVQEADFIYTDLWWWVGQEEEIPDRYAAFMGGSEQHRSGNRYQYQVNMELLKKAPPTCKVMHCLPASRGVEATDEVLDSPQSIIFDQSENRLHTEKGLLVYFTYPHLKRASTEQKAYHSGRILAFLDK